MAYYAWSPIKYDAKVDKDSGAVMEVAMVQVGESVTAAKLGISEEEFDALIESGAVREDKYPEEAMERDVPPAQVMQEQASAAMEAASQGELPKSKSKEDDKS